MKHKHGLIGLFTLGTMFLAGCLGTTRSTVTEYRADGTIERCTVSDESVIESLTQSTRNKTIVVWESGWMAYLSGSTATTDDPTPHIKLFAGKSDKGLISALSGQQNWDGIARTIEATRAELTIGATGLVEKAGGSAATATAGAESVAESTAAAATSVATAAQTENSVTQTVSGKE